MRDSINNPATIALRAVMAEEALCGSEIEGIKLSPRERFITKCKMIWPDLDTKELGLVFDHMEKEKANG